jgi:carbonic anhydrase/acetyltransferase-like protein (isoleucine patch superfamily)
MSSTLCLIGCGTAFESIVADPVGHCLPQGWTFRRAAGVPSLSGSAIRLLEGLSPEITRIFIAVDQNALNYARLELYGRARLQGFRLAKIIHAHSFCSPDAVIGENVWIGVGTVISSATKIGANVLVSPHARLDFNVKVSSHCWIGPGAVLGESSKIGSHTVIGADTKVISGATIGKHCVVDTSLLWSQDMPDGAFVTQRNSSPARIAGAGYSFTKFR